MIREKSNACAFVRLRVSRSRRYGWRRLGEAPQLARFSRITSFVLLGVALRVPAVAQRVVPDEVTCPKCVVEVFGPVVLQTDRMPAGLSGLPYPVGRDRSGRFWVLAHGEPPAVFASDGRFLRVLGRSGSGPGEFRSPLQAVALPGDSILIVDAGLERATVIAPNLSVARTVSVPIRSGPVAVLQWPDRVVMNSEINSPESAGWPLHFLDFSGGHARRLDAFGENRGELRPGQPGALVRRFFGVRGASFWTLQPARFQFTRFANTGTPEETVVRRTGWFPEVSVLGSLSPTSPPQPHVSLAAV